MKGKSTLKLVISEITAVGVIVVPLALWFFEDYSLETVVVLYALESLIAMILVVLCVLALAPPQERLPDKNKTLVRREMISGTLIVAGMGTFIIYAFIGALIFLAPKGKGVELTDLKFGLMCVLAFQLFEFFSNLYLLRPLSLKESDLLLSANFGTYFLLIFSLLVGMFFGIFFDASVFLPFIVFKTLLDFAAPILYFTGNSYAPPPSE